MLGVMFSGRHDLEAMKCSDGSFFIDRDGTYFRHILNYLRDGEDAVDFFPVQFPGALRQLLHEAKYYQLESLATVLTPLVRECSVVSQNDISSKCICSRSRSGTNYVDYGVGSPYLYSETYQSKEAISYKLKNMRGLSFSKITFLYPVSFIDCDLSNASFDNCCFESDVIFKDCILDDTKFNFAYGLVTNSHNVSFTGSKTDMTNFDADLKIALRSAKKIN